MAFDIDTASPPDNQIVSQFPAAERAHRVQLENIVTAEHNEATGLHVFPQGTIANRDAMSPKVAGMVHFAYSGTISQRNTLGLGWNEYGVHRPGDVKIVAYSSVPDRWVLCDGTKYDGAAADYADLFAAIGTTYNTGGEVGDEFRVPNMGGKAIFGWKSGGDSEGDFASVGETSTDRTHNHGGAAAMGTPSSTITRGAGGTAVADSLHKHTLVNDTHVPPYMTFKVIIKL
jgi:microcystin-dependent protein